MKPLTYLALQVVLGACYLTVARYWLVPALARAIVEGLR